jgi:hypothetical protein
MCKRNRQAGLSKIGAVGARRTREKCPDAAKRPENEGVSDARAGFPARQARGAAMIRCALAADCAQSARQVARHRALPAHRAAYSPRSQLGLEANMSGRNRGRTAHLGKVDNRARALGCVLGAFLAAWLWSVPAAATGPQPLEPQPAAEALAPGLAVRYYNAFFRLIDEFVEWRQQDPGVPGTPIPDINFRVAGGPVLTSGIVDGVGAEITGLIRLDRPGSYGFLVQSNDGFRLEIGGVQVLEDPDVHADRYSNIAKLSIEKPGWYPLTMLYFQRKGTATIELYWKPPGEEAGSMAFVPAKAFAHLKAE